MKLTATQLRRIIKEEVESALAPHKFVGYYSAEDLEDMTDMSLRDMSSQFGVTLTPSGETTVVTGPKQKIIGFLEFVNSSTMGQGEGPEDWEGLIKPVR